MKKFELSYSKAATWLFVLMTATDLAFSESVELYKIPKLLILLFCAVMLIWILFVKKTIPTTNALFAPLSFTFLELISYFWAVYPSAVFSQMITQFQLTLLFVFVFLLFRCEDHLDDYIKAVYYSGFIMVAYMLYAYGLNDILAQMLAGIRVGRLIGNENSIGMVFSRSALMAFGYFIPKHKPGYLIVMAVMTFFAFSTGSRKAILIILVGVVAIITFYYGIKKAGKMLFWLLVVAGAAFLIMQLPFMRAAAQRLVDLIQGKQDASAIERKRMIQVGWEAIQERMFLGYGLSNFEEIFSGTGYSHNNFIEILFGMGFIGFMLYYTMHIQAGYSIFKLIIHGADWRYVVLFVLLGINIVFGWAMVQFYTRESWVFLAVILATSERTLRKGEKINGDYS